MEVTMSRKITMSRKTTVIVAIAGILTILNAGLLVLQLSPPSKAAIAGMDAQGLARDGDFKRAVQLVVEGCKVNVDLAKVQC
jgi:hypothetical protein